LTWIGKENRPKLEPRILIEDPEKSYHAAHRVSENDIFDNRLIFGDNLLALKALEQDLAGKVKCIYIDPPYNTGSAFDHYEDGIEHSLWLSMMRDRLESLRALLSENGSIWISIDDHEMAYLRVLMDELFGRKNFVAQCIWEKVYSPKSTAKHLSENHDYVVCYAKDIARWKRNLLPRTEKQNKAYKNPDNDSRGPWKPGDLSARNYYSVGRYPITCPSGRVIEGPPQGMYWRVSKEKLAELDKDERIWWGKDGNNVPAIKRFLSEVIDGIVPETIWTYNEVGHNQSAKQHLKKLLPKVEDLFVTPKPEGLIERILRIATDPGDVVLDSFAGTGTTGCAAHKMRRRWVMIELGDHCETHLLPRLQQVIDGTDLAGITESAKWIGGGGFRYFKLGPTLIVEDEWGNPVINPDFNAAMLTEALCKLEGFTFEPDAEVYWQQGRSSESDFIYVTTQFMSKAMLAHLSDEVGPSRSLLICCGAFRCDVKQFENLTVKKIPKAVLKKCEWGHDDYSLEIENLPDAPPEVVQQRKAEAPEANQPARKFGKDRAKDKGPTLFDMDAVAAKGGK
jgi:adenine-specific DNA-methyltransferase